ncbi:DUF724 domain-containing protein 7 isoform X2 [Eutrema salsugineum]|uniref:DUF724 domain-containing protein 7 isoform X2 n=1 Tax=Eutrema salsugineum TaxID=72664 RepID=UPI000CECF24A|nr:DUF724 domain-containing protein 7 isoform X2 [Eutrema salsugineum]
MLLTTGRKEKLFACKGSEIEVTFDHGTGYVWYRALLEENLSKSKRKKLSVRHLKPLVKEDYSPPLVTTSFHRLIRPAPPQDPFPDLDFEEGDMIDAAHQGAWWSGWVVKVLGFRRFLVYLRFEPDVIELERNHLRPHLVWKDEEWFRCEKRQLTESDFSAGKTLEVRNEVEPFGDVWAPAIAIKENEDGTLLVKYKTLSGECNKTSVPYSKIRPSPPPSCLDAFRLMQNVDALLECGWCQGVVMKVLSGKRYSVLLGQNKQSKDFGHLQLRPSMEWKDGAWQTEEQVLGREESPHAAEETTASTRIRITVRSALRDIKASAAGKKLRVTRSSSGTIQNPLIGEAGKESVFDNETQLSQTAVSSGDLASKKANAVITAVASQPKIAATKEFYSSLVLGVAAPRLTKPPVKTQGKTSPRKKLVAMKTQKGSANDAAGEKGPEESKNRENVNKRKRGRQPRKFISTEPKQKQKTGEAGNVGLADMSDENQPLASWIQGEIHHRFRAEQLILILAFGSHCFVFCFLISSSGQSASRTPDPMLNSVVEKHVDVVEAPAAKDSTMVLPFAKKSPCWKVLESMEIFKAVPQRPHFIPLLECEEESREGDAIGAMVKFTGLLEKVNNIQVDDPISALNRINECFRKLEEHGFDATAPRSRIGKLLCIKESQTWALEELQVVERGITEKDNKRRKCEEDIEEVSRKIVELKRQEALLKEEKVTMDKEIARMHSHAAVLDQKVQNVEQEFRATVTAPW